MKTKTDPMDEAYKLLDGQPSATGVSDAAKGLAPKSDNEDREDNQIAHDERLYGSADKKQVCTDIDEAYAMLFESLAIIMRTK
jgi:hypothetical protein